MSYASAQERLLREEVAAAAQVGAAHYAKKQKRLAKRGNVLSEAQMQMDFVDWCKSTAARFPVFHALADVVHIPNGEMRPKMQGRDGSWFSPTGRKLQRMGERKGMPDLLFPFGCREWHALYQEVKLPDGKLSPEQVAVHAMLRGHGNRVDVCYSLDALKDSVCDYLGIGDWREWEK